MNLTLTVLAAAALIVIIILLIAVVIGSRKQTSREIRALRDDMAMLTNMMMDSQQAITDLQDKRLKDISDILVSNTVTSEQRLESIRNSMESNLERMRETVDEKLQETLEERISRSFRTVSERLEQVYKGLGEMRTLASGVGDLKKVLSNVKTRGILGEIQLGAILEQILSPDQYEENVRTRSSGNERVEFAVKLPGDGNGTIWLPIDAKFPGDAYANLRDAYDTGDPDTIDRAGKQLETAIRKAAKDIRDKYVEPPYTTDFAIMFLPFEGLYAEVVRRGMIERLQAEYMINIAGPATMAALLNSLQMGFRTLAIEKHSSEIREVLEAVKTEFARFEVALNKTHEKLGIANKELENLMGTRTNAINRKLRGLSTIDQSDADKILGFEDRQL